MHAHGARTQIFDGLCVGTVPGCSVRIGIIYGGQTHHVTFGQDQLRLPYHHGGGSPELAEIVPSVVRLSLITFSAELRSLLERTDLENELNETDTTQYPLM